MRFELEEQKIMLGFDTGSGTYPSQARTKAQSSPIILLSPPNFTLTPVKAQTGIPNMHVSGTKYGMQPQLGKAMQATGITSLLTRPLFYWQTKPTTIPYAQALIRRFTTIGL